MRQVAKFEDELTAWISDLKVAIPSAIWDVSGLAVREMARTADYC
jgi:hypothetical protein